MNNQTIYLIGLIFSGALVFLSGRENYMDYCAKKYGELVIAEVHKEPICSRSMNKMNVKYQNSIGIVHIGKSKCHDGFYKVGDKINILYYKENNYFIMPYRPINRRIVVTCVGLLIPLYCLYKLIKP